MSGEREADALRFLGLAQRAGGVVPGVSGTREALRTGRARLVVMAADASPGQLRKVRGLLEHREVPVRWVTTNTRLGKALGRADVSVLAVTTNSFAEQLSGRLPDRPAEPPEGNRRAVRGTDDRKPEEDSSTDAGR